MFRLALPLIEVSSLFPGHEGTVLLAWIPFVVAVLILKERKS